VYIKLTPNSTIGVSSLAFEICLLFALPSFSAPADPAVSMPEFCKKLPRADHQNLRQIPVESEWFKVYGLAPGLVPFMSRINGRK
jgi:hypothetical protein